MQQEGRQRILARWSTFFLVVLSVSSFFIDLSSVSIITSSLISIFLSPIVDVFAVDLILYT